MSFELGGKNAMIVMPDVAVGAVKGMNLEVCQGSLRPSPPNWAVVTTSWAG